VTVVLAPVSDETGARPLCIVCNINYAKRILKNGVLKGYRAKCTLCGDANRTERTGRGYTKHKKDHCEKCGFVPEDECQLSVDHIDGDKTNESEDNFQTLCLNCHALKTKLNRDSVNVKYRQP
jgi:hypothetical protein